MSVQCPHCGGEFQVQLTLSVPAVKNVTIPVSKEPVEPLTASQIGLVGKPQKAPKFSKSPAGKLRQALYNAGYVHAAKNGIIFNDKRTGGEARLKLRQSSGAVYEEIEYLVIDNHLKAAFDSDLKFHSPYGNDYVVQIYRAI